MTTPCIVPDLEEPIRAELFASSAASRILTVLRLRRSSSPNRDSILYSLRLFWKAAAWCWSPAESLPGRFSRSM